MSDLTLLADGATLHGPTSDDANQDVSPAGDDGTPSPEASGADQDAASTKTNDWRKQFDEATDPLDLFQRASRTLSRDEILRDPTLAGILGDAADKLERKRTAEREREAEATRKLEAERTRDAELDELVDNEDVLTLGERSLEERRQLREQRQSDQERAKHDSEFAEAYQARVTGALDRFVDAQPPAIRQQMQALARTRQAAYAEAGEWDGGYRLWLADVVGVHVEHAKASWEKSTREALRLEITGEIEGGEAGASPEFGAGGGAASAGVVTQAEWDANRRDTTWRRANHDRILRAVAAGHIRE